MSLFSIIVVYLAFSIQFIKADHYNNSETIIVENRPLSCRLRDYLLTQIFGLTLMKTCTNLKSAPIYLLYEINPPEGFNLRRDVYIRLAVFIRRLKHRHKRFKNIKLVLPPWRWLYHWKSYHVPQSNLPWSDFFDIESLRRFAPVLDFPEFVEELSHLGYFIGENEKHINVDKVYQLMQFEEMFENGVFRDKFEFNKNCERIKLDMLLSELEILRANDIECVNFQGGANILEHILWRGIKIPDKMNHLKIFALLNAEIILHDHWGDREYWRARRSMRFADHLIKIADKYRFKQFNSTNLFDLVQIQPLWEYQVPYRKAVGGPYLCAHIRRGDFIHGRETTTPTIKSAAMQIKQKLYDLNLTTVFLTTDANAYHIKNLKSYVQRHRLVHFTTESLIQKANIKDGGIAIIDQIICSHARHFIGTYESTFTYRIYEEREILGFPTDSTFNTFCKSSTLENCYRNTIWPIVY